MLVSLYAMVTFTVMHTKQNAVNSNQMCFFRIYKHLLGPSGIVEALAFQADANA